MAKMVATTHDEKVLLESEGLHVSCYSDRCLWIAASVRDAGGIRLSDDACCLFWKSGRWVAVFPAEGQLIYEVPGSLSELVSLITAVYAHYRRTGGHFRAAFSEVVSEAEKYLVGRSPARV